MKIVRHSVWTRRMLLASPLILALAACDQEVTTDPVPEVPLSMVVVSGNNQTGVVGEELSNPLVVRVLNGSGLPVSGQVVNWRVLQGGGELFAGVGVTDGNGQAQERWRLGPTAGATQVVEARAVNPTTGDKLTFGTFTATATAPGATPGTPAQPSSLTVTTANVNADTFAVTARWGKASNSAQYEWSMGANGNGYSRSGLVPDTTVTVRVPRITGVTGYWFCVAGVNTAGTRGAVACGPYAPPTTGGGSTPAAVASVTVTPTSASVAALSTVQLAAVTRDSAGNVLTGRAVTWSSSNTARATVSASGLVTGVTAGTATITATSEGRSASSAITVTAGTSTPAPVASITLSPLNPSLQAGSTVQLTATLRDASNNILTGRTVSWSSSNSAQASVNSSGLVTGASAGMPTITATSEGRTATTTVTVTSPPPPPPTSGSAYFRSNWSTATGSTTTATRDGGAWNASYCNHTDVLAVIPGSSVGWTATPNVLQVTNHGSTRCYQLENSTSIPTGVSFYIRAYVRVETGASTAAFHPTALMPMGDIHAAFWGMDKHDASTYRPTLRLVKLPYSNMYWAGPRVQRGQWYRFEYHVEVDGTRFRIWPRVYDMAGNLVADASGFTHIDGGSRTLKQFYDAGNWSPASSADAIRRIGMGWEGSAGASDNGAKWYYAGVEVGSTWRGPIQ